MIKDFLHTFRKPSAATLARVELEEAQRQLLAAKSSAEYATRMAQYQSDRIQRLINYLKEAA